MIDRVVQHTNVLTSKAHHRLRNLGIKGHEVYPDPAGHPFCIGWKHPSAEAPATFVKEHLGLDHAAR